MGRLIIISLLLMAGGCADSLILYPPKEAAVPAGAERRMVPVRDEAVEVWIKRAASERAEVFVLEFTGNAMRAEHVVLGTARRFANLNAEVWSVNYPGYGGSGGKAKLSAIPPAALGTYEAMKQESGNRPIVVVGRSIGTTAALYVASKRPVAGVVLHSPVPLNRVIFGKFGWWNLWIASSIVAAQVPGELQALSTAPKCSAPAVFIVSEQDQLVSAGNQGRVIGAYGGKKTVIPLEGADHNTPASREEEERIRRAVEGLLGG
jgi:pimeloyl-ACP methyl ester carboxylesterase